MSQIVFYSICLNTNSNYLFCRLFNKVKAKISRDSLSIVIAYALIAYAKIVFHFLWIIQNKTHKSQFNSYPFVLRLTFQFTIRILNNEVIVEISHVT